MIWDETLEFRGFKIMPTVIPVTGAKLGVMASVALLLSSLQYSPKSETLNPEEVELEKLCSIDVLMSFIFYLVCTF